MPDVNAYRFITRWRVAGTCGEVADILENPNDLPRWWPSVCLDVREIDPPGANGLGRRVWLHTKGWLPYTLNWELLVSESRYPNGFTVAATGDFDGRGIWTIVQDGQFVDVTFDWQLRANKPLIKHLSFFLKPLFESNHRWAMAQGEESLTLELARRRAASAAARSSIPPPPGPVTYAAVALLAGAAAIGAGLAYLMIRARRSKSGSS